MTPSQKVRGIFYAPGIHFLFLMFLRQERIFAKSTSLCAGRNNINRAENAEEKRRGKNDRRNRTTAAVRSSKTLKVVKMGVMVAISVALVYLIHFPIFPVVSFLEYDPADIPILIGTFAIRSAGRTRAHGSDIACAGTYSQCRKRTVWYPDACDRNRSTCSCGRETFIRERRQG